MRTPEPIRTGSGETPFPRGSRNKKEAEPLLTIPAAVRYPVVLNHLQAMTDGTGLVQHGVGGVPDLATGYTTDDNARAFLAMVRLWRPCRNAAPNSSRFCAVTWRSWPGCSIATAITRAGLSTSSRMTAGSWTSAVRRTGLGRCLLGIGEALSGPLPRPYAARPTDVESRLSRWPEVVRRAPSPTHCSACAMRTRRYEPDPFLRRPLCAVSQTYGENGWNGWNRT